MRLLAIVLLAACTPELEQPIAMPAAARASTFEVAFVDTIDHAPATHLAVGGKLRVRLPDHVTWTSTIGPFALASTGDGFAITATGAGRGEIELETATGYTRIAISAAPIASVGLVFDAASERHATIVLRDANGLRLVDASLRVAPGSAPVSFLRDAWDRIEIEKLPPGAVLVKTDLLGPTRAVPGERTSDSLAQR